MTAPANPGPERGRLIAVASGKGGVGKTFLAITLAHAMAARGSRVLLFDGDLGLANIDIQLGLVPARDIATHVGTAAGVLAAVQPCPPCGFDWLPGRSGAAHLTALAETTLAQLLHGLRAATDRYDVVIADLAAGIDPPARRIAATADTLLLVATDDPTSLTDAYAVLKLHAADGGSTDRAVVINQVQSPAEGRRAFHTLARAAENFLGITPRLAGTVRRDPRVRDTIRHQTPLLTRHPQAPAAADIVALARELTPERRVARGGERVPAAGADDPGPPGGREDA